MPVGDVPMGDGIPQPDYTKTRTHGTGDAAQVAGEIRMVGNSWLLDLDATRRSGEEDFSLG